MLSPKMGIVAMVDDCNFGTYWDICTNLTAGRYTTTMAKKITYHIWELFVI